MSERAPQQSVGGQAVIEGVMMKSPEGVAVAVRRADGSLLVRDRPWLSLTKRVKPLGWPFVRGVVVLVESLSGGIDALRFSAEAAVAESEVEAKGAGAVGPLAMTGGGGGGGSSKSASFSANLALFLGFALALLIFKGVPHLVAMLTGLEVTDPLFHLVDGAVKLTLVVGYIAAISQMDDIKRVFQYHGAEHKSIRAFEEGLELNVKNARSQSREHERCGTSFIVVVVMASVVVYIALSPLLPADLGDGWRYWAAQAGLIVAKVLLLAPVGAIAYEINRFAGKHWKSPWSKLITWPGLLIQRTLTTREPTDDQLEVALAALRTSLSLAPEGGRAGPQPWRLRSFDDFEAFISGRDEEDGLVPERATAG